MPDPSNQAALDSVFAWPDWPAPVLLLSGPPATGKSHLLRIWAEQTGAVLLDGSQPSLSWPENQDGLPVIAIDNADHITDQVALLHCFNSVTAANGYLLMAAENPPQLWLLDLPDLTSRLNAAPHVTIGEPSDDLLAMLLIKQLNDRQLIVEQPVIDYLLKRMPRRAADIKTIVASLDRHSLQHKRAITTALAREVLSAN